MNFSLIYIIAVVVEILSIIGLVTSSFLLMASSATLDIEENITVTSKYEDKTIEEVVEEEIDKQMETVKPIVVEKKEEVRHPNTALYYPDIPMEKHYQTVLFTAIDEYHVGVGLALAIIESETHFDVYADSVHNGVNYYGCWQISEIHKYRMREDYGLDITDPEDNVIAGCIILSELIDKYWDYGVEYVINAYKGGESAAAKWYEEGFVLPCVDEITDRAMYFEKLTGAEQ